MKDQILLIHATALKVFFLSKGILQKKSIFSSILFIEAHRTGHFCYKTTLQDWIWKTQKDIMWDIDYSGNDHIKVCYVVNWL